MPILICIASDFVIRFNLLCDWPCTFTHGDLVIMPAGGGEVKRCGQGANGGLAKVLMVVMTIDNG